MLSGKTNKEIVQDLVTFIVNDPEISLPVYLPEIKREEDAKQLGISPLVYAWNENRRLGSFTVSINGKSVDYLLEAFIPREDNRFIIIRDELMSLLQKTLLSTVTSMCEKMGTYPSELFKKG